MQHQLVVQVQDQDGVGVRLHPDDLLDDPVLEDERRVDVILVDGALNEHHLPLVAGEKLLHPVDILPTHEALRVDEHDGLLWVDVFVLHREQPAIQDHALLEPLVLGQGHHGGGAAV